MRRPLAALFLALALASAPSAQSAPPPGAPASPPRPGGEASAGASPEASDPPARPESLDARVLRLVHAADAPAFVWAMREANASTYPLFIAAAPVSAGGALLAGESVRPAARLLLAQSATTALTVAGKRAVGRRRPYTALPGVASRDRGTAAEIDRASFPSGHTSIAFAVATSASLSYPEWYVAVPAFAWAGAVGVSRVWHGVHYPSDVLAGAALGAGVAALVHVLVPDPSGEGGATVLTFRVGL